MCDMQLSTLLASRYFRKSVKIWKSVHILLYNSKYDTDKCLPLICV